MGGCGIGMATGSKEAILLAAKETAQARGYNGLNFRDLANQVGIKAASIYYYFPSKAELGEAVARRYWEDTKEVLEEMLAEAGSPLQALRQYPQIFRQSLARDNRLCLCSFMSAEYDDLPEPVKKEVRAFADVNVDWLSRVLVAADLAKAAESEARARAIFAAVVGAQLLARGRSDLALFDELIRSYSAAGLLPA